MEADVKRLDELRSKTRRARRELDRLHPAGPSPELIESANILRQNEQLHRLDQKKSELIADYEEYVRELESTLSLVFGIQNDLISLVRQQARMIKPTRKR